MSQASGLHWKTEMGELLNERHIASLSSNRLISFYLTSSYAYYELNETFMEDSAYDLICQRLKAEWHSINHPHKHFVDKTGLDATTGFALKFHKLPLIVRGATFRLLELARSGKIGEAVHPTKVTRRALVEDAPMTPKRRRAVLLESPPEQPKRHRVQLFD